MPLRVRPCRDSPETAHIERMGHWLHLSPLRQRSGRITRQRRCASLSARGATRAATPRATSRCGSSAVARAAASPTREATHPTASSRMGMQCRNLDPKAIANVRVRRSPTARPRGNSWIEILNTTAPSHLSGRCHCGNIALVSCGPRAHPDTRVACGCSFCVKMEVSGVTPTYA